MWQIYDYYMFFFYGIICDTSNVWILIITYNNISKPPKKHCQQNHDFDPLAGIPGSRAVAGGPILPSLVPVPTARTPVGDRHGIYQQSDINEDTSGAYQFTFAKYGSVYICKIWLGDCLHLQNILVIVTMNSVWVNIRWCVCVYGFLWVISGCCGLLYYDTVYVFTGHWGTWLNGYLLLLLYNQLHCLLQ